ncbi:reverse transcriptase domain-containing protein [Tanacetum coccineum]
MLEVVTALAAEEEHSTSPHSRAASSARDAQGTPDQSAAQAIKEVKRLKRQTLSQAKQIIKLKTKLKKLSKFVQPVVKHHAFWVESQNLKKRRKKQRKKHKKKVSSVNVGRNKDEGTLSEEHYVQEDYTADVVFEDIVERNVAVTPDFERKSDETEALERKSDETKEIITARQSTITPRTLIFDDEAGPSSPIRPTQNIEPEEQFKVDEVLADISRPRGLSIPGKGIMVEEPKKKKLTLQQIRALETTNDEEVARKIQAEWDAEEERKRFEELKKAKPKTTLRKPTSLAQERNQMMNFLKGQGYKNLQKLKYPQMKELYDKVQESIKDSFKDFIPMDSEREKQLLQERDTKKLLRKRKATISKEKPSKKLKLRTETIDALRNYLRIIDFEQNAQDRESQEGISVITEFKVIDSPDGEYLIIFRANNHFRAFNTLWEILHILDRQDLYHLHRINANNFELKQPLINLVQSNKFTGRQDPHNHLRFFNKVTSTFRHPEVPNTSIKLLLFPFSLDGEARDWLDKEPPRSILTWDDLVAKFINQFFPPSKTTYYRNEIITFFQKPNETFNEAWERFKGLLRQCPHHGFSELHQLDTFYNSLNSNDQDALDSAAGGNFLDKMPQEGLAIIESKSKVRYSRSRANDSRVSTDAPLSNSSPSNNSFDIQQLAASLEDKMTIKMKQMMNEMKALVVTTPAPIKAVEEVCVTCGSNHNFNHCPLTRGGNDFPVFHDNIQQFQQTAAVGNFLQRNQPSNLASQMKPPGFNQPNVQNNQNRYQGNNFNSNQNRGTNFNQNRQNNQNQVFQPPTNQPPVYQVPIYQAPTPQIQGVSKTDFENYVKANDAVLKNVQNQGK